MSDYGAVDALMAIPIAEPEALLADKGYDGDAIRESLLLQDILKACFSRSTIPL